jgi:WD40 repeat protein
MYKKVMIWDLEAKKMIAGFSDSEAAVLGLAFSPDGKRLFGACKDNAARVWTVGSAADAKKLPHNWAVNAIGVSPDGKVVATMTDNGVVNLWDAATLKKTKELAHSNTGRSIAFSADGKTLVSGGGEMVKVWDMATGAEKASAKAEANSVAISADGATIVVGTQDNLVMCFDGSLNLKWKAEKHDRPVTGVVISPDGKTAYTCSMDRIIKIWNLK